VDRFILAPQALCLALAIASLGCENRLGASVSGSVTLDGKPLTTGNVAFVDAGGGAVALGPIDSQGKYTVSTGTELGLAPGKYTVTVVATEEPVVPADPNIAPAAPKLISPAKYSDASTSDLQVDVRAGANDIPLVLKSQS
jgi:hypothetical protein